MDIVQIYVVAAGSALAMLILLNLVNHATDFINFTSRLIRKYLTYPIVLHRHIFAGPWSPADILVQSSYIAVVAFCLQYKTTSLSTRSGYLALGNSILLYAGPHLSFLADVLGLYRSSYYSLHKIVGLMSYALVFLHIGVELVTTSLLNEFSLHSSENIFAIIVRPTPCVTIQIKLTSI
jgi:ferric-chelate reductase